MISESSVYAGGAVYLNAEVNGSASTDVTWSVNDNKHPNTRIDVVSTPYNSYDVLMVSIYEDAEELVIRTTSNEDPSKYDELTLAVIPAEYVSQLRFTSDAYAACVDTSTTAIDLIHRFGESFRIEDPENNVHAEMACGLYRVPEGYSETEPFELEGNVISTKYESPVKAAYMSEGKYVTIPGSNGPDGSHSFVVPEGVEDVVLVVKGDADKDGKFTNFNVTLAKGALMGRHVSFDTFSKLASDISADGDFSNYDLTLMKAIVMGRYENGWS